MLIILELTEPILPDIYLDSSKHKPAPPITVSNINATVMKVGKR